LFLSISPEFLFGLDAREDFGFRIAPEHKPWRESGGAKPQSAIVLSVSEPLLLPLLFSPQSAIRNPQFLALQHASAAADG
jgi:hypothetical protein